MTQTDGMRVYRFLLVFFLGTACHRSSPSSSPAGSSDAAYPSPPAPTSAVAAPEDPFDADTHDRLAEWFKAVGPAGPKEKFGSLIVRAGKVQLGKPYFGEPSKLAPETLTCRLDSFECVTFVESTLALSRCIWLKQPDAACFARNLTTLRYRGGRMQGYPSRLHFFEDWLGDNAGRGLMTLMTAKLGGVPVVQPTTFMTGHPTLFPSMADPNIRSEIQATELRVSAMHPVVLDRTLVRKAEPQLQDGDVVAIAVKEPDILVSHTGFVSHDAGGVVRLLHASSFRYRVVYSEQDLAQYILRRPERRGVLVARPLPPT